jgi:putative ABC transport system ATP-binding protein
MLAAHQLTKQVSTQEGRLDILQPLSLTVAAGESLAITGASGSGKSTLLGILAGLDLPTSGQLTLNGHDLLAMNEEQRAKVRADNVGFVFQSFQLLPGLTALENVMLPLELFDNKRAKQLAQEYLEKVGLAHRMSHYPKQLSGGEQQRVAIARAFATKPKVLFADEPTGNLDSKTGAHIIELLFELNKSENTTLILVTHEQRLADRCQQMIEVEAGQIVQQRDRQHVGV